MRPILAAALSMLVLVSTLMTGCSGGGGGAGSGAAPAAANLVTGIAATGAAVSGQVNLTDSSTPSRTLTTRTASDGSYAFSSEGLTPPYIIKASYSDETGVHNLYSIASEAGITNITPLTTIIVAQAASGSNLDSFYTNHTAADLAAVAAKMPVALKDLQTALAPLMAQYGVTGFDVLHGRFAADQTGVDAMMDDIKVAIADGAVTISTKTDNTPLFIAQVKNLAAGALTMVNPAPMPSTSNGSQLYSSKCAWCHGNIASSNLKGRVSAATAQSAITSNLGGMGALSGISAADLQSITEALAATVPASTPAPSTPAVPAGPAGPAGTNKPDGAALYAANCAGCHGTLASSRKTGATVVRTQNAISGNVGGMGSLASLTAADIQAIVTVLNPAGSTPAPVPAPAPTPAPGTTPVPTPAPVISGATEYSNSCAGCHQPLATSTKQGTTAARLDNAISGNIGGMGFLSSLTTAIRQAIVAVLNPGATVPAPTPTPAPVPVPTPAPVPGPAPDGAALYAANCAGCHGTLGTSSKKGITIARLQSAINNNIGGMGPLSRLTVTDVQAIVTALTPATPVPTPTPAPAPNPTPTPAPDGAALYTSNCAGCHGPLATSGKTGATAARIQAAISGNTGNMGYLSTLTAAQVTAISKSLTPVVTPTPTPAPNPSPTPAPAADGAALYTSNCAGCHGPLATSGKAGATGARIQAAITGNIGNMGYLSTLTPAQVTAVAGALAVVTPPTNPAPAPACGSCHAIPPSSGHHSTHVSKKVACVTCHGTGYSTTTVNAATHNNGVKNVASTIGWNATSRSCSNSCHGKKTW